MNSLSSEIETGGGPYIVLPRDVGIEWAGAAACRSTWHIDTPEVMDKKTDYDAACQFSDVGRGVVDVAGHNALVLAADIDCLKVYSSPRRFAFVQIAGHDEEIIAPALEAWQGKSKVVLEWEVTARRHVVFDSAIPIDGLRKNERIMLFLEPRLYRVGLWTYEALDTGVTIYSVEPPAGRAVG